MDLPQTIYVALGAVLAALVAGFFSFLNLVSAKENKVSEFRLSWIDGLRNDISTHTAAVQALARIESFKTVGFDSPKDWFVTSEDTYRNAVESLTNIALRLNPKHAEENPSSQEAILMGAIHQSRALFNQGKVIEALDSCADIRKAAAPLLKAEWERVKNGEPGYQEIRKKAYRTIKIGIIFVALMGTSAIIFTIIHQSSAIKQPKPTTPAEVQPKPKPAAIHPKITPAQGHL